jgi:hypothetical protein
MPITADMSGFPLLLLPPDLTNESPSFSVGVDTEEFTGDSGGELRGTMGGQPNHLRQHSFTFQSRAEFAEFDAFVRDRAGRYEPFWMPSWADDFHVLGGDLFGVSVRYGGYSERLWPSLAYRRILIQRNGNPEDYWTRYVDGMTDAEDGTEWFAAVLGFPYPMDFAGLTTAQGHRFMWLHFCRLDADSIDYVFSPSSEMVEVKLAVLTIPEEAP